MKLKYFEVDAFTSRPLHGNPAGVCPLPDWLSGATMQSIAAENNLAETAFFVARGTDYDLRWFTPTMEIDLCGHATLASAFIVFSELNHGGETVRFHSRSGILTVAKENDVLVMDFPARPPESCVRPEGLPDALGAPPMEILASRDYFAVFASEEDVQTLRPDFGALQKLDRFGVIATAPGRDCDFVSRFFVPKAGVPEDPVTGSSHCTLIPYWARRLVKTKLFARQISRRGGELFCEAAGDRVKIGGKAVLYNAGHIFVDDAPTQAC